MNWGLLALFAGIVALIGISNIWLRRRANAQESPATETGQAEVGDPGR